MIRFNRLAAAATFIALAAWCGLVVTASARDTAPVVPNPAAVFASEVYGTQAAPAAYVFAQVAPGKLGQSTANVSFFNGDGKPLTTFVVQKFDPALTKLTALGENTANIEGDGIGGTADVAGRRVHIKIVLSATSCTAIITGDVSRQVTGAGAVAGAVQFR